jgi:hypothetical protein
MTKVDLTSTLPSSLVMVVTVTGSTTQTAPLPKEDLDHAVEGCEEAQYLADCKAKTLKFIESRMMLLAPNISVILGTTVAAKLLGRAGGLNALSTMPSCNIQVRWCPRCCVRSRTRTSELSVDEVVLSVVMRQVLGQKKRHALGGFSAMAALRHTGFVYYSPIVQSAPTHLRMKAADLTANKYGGCALRRPLHLAYCVVVSSRQLSCRDVAVAVSASQGRSGRAHRLPSKRAQWRQGRGVPRLHSGEDCKVAAAATGKAEEAAQGA